MKSIWKAVCSLLFRNLLSCDSWWHVYVCWYKSYFRFGLQNRSVANRLFSSSYRSDFFGSPPPREFVPYGNLKYWTILQTSKERHYARFLNEQIHSFVHFTDPRGHEQNHQGHHQAAVHGESFPRVRNLAQVFDGQNALVRHCDGFRCSDCRSRSPGGRGLSQELDLLWPSRCVSQMKWKSTCDSVVISAGSVSRSPRHAPLLLDWQAQARGVEKKEKDTCGGDCW